MAEKEHPYLTEIKELIDNYGLDKISSILGKSSRGVQYWLSDKDPKIPNPKTKRTIHELHVKHNAGENILEMNGEKNDYKDKLIAALERENNRLQKDLDLSLGELRHNILLTRAIAETNQNALIEVLAKQRKTTVAAVALEKNKENIVTYTKLKEEGSFAYVGK